VKVGDMIRMVAQQRNHVGLLVSVDRRHGVDCNRHSRIATVMTTEGKLVTWPLDSHYKIEVVA
jgi:hypothetical protein